MVSQAQVWKGVSHGDSLLSLEIVLREEAYQQGQSAWCDAIATTYILLILSMPAAPMRHPRVFAQRSPRRRHKVDSSAGHDEITQIRALNIVSSILDAQYTVGCAR